MIDKLFIRPLLAVGTFVKRNPLLSLLLFAILFLLPPLIYAVTKAFGWVLDLTKTIFGVKAAESLAKVFNDVLNWMQAHHWACPALAFVLALVSPLAGGFLAAWCFVDKFKEGPQLIPLPKANPAPPPPPGEIEPDITEARPTEVLDDFFGGQA